MCLKPESSNKAVKKQREELLYSNSKNKGSSSSAGTTGKAKIVASTHSLHKRETKYDLLFFLLPALCWKVTPVLPTYIIAFARIISTHAILTLHYIFVDKDNYNNKLTQKQLAREKDDYLVGPVIHMYAQIALQIIFPSMFFSDLSLIKSCALNTFISHVVAVEPLYYFAHRWLHVPEHMKSMHGFHHLSINTLPSTSLVQNFQEHFVYIATFGPAFLLPFFIGGCQHWTVIGAYLVLFDIINAFGHMNLRLRHWVFTHPYSPIKYLFYTPEFHLGHHAYFRANYALFMPFWDFIMGTHRDYQKNDPELLPPKQQDFVFIGHNGGLGHLLTCPELSVYNVYDSYRRTFLPLQVEFILVHIICLICRIFIKCYSLSRYLINGSKIGRIICVLRTPIDYIYPSHYKGVNEDIVQLIKDQYVECGTRYFGLGNLNKMKQLNDGGRVIVDMINKDSYLKDKKIRIWTGDTMTAASVYNQIVEIPNIEDVFYIGANGKIGNAVCELITKRHPNIKIKVFSSYQGMDHPNISYTTDLTEMLNYRIVVTGKFLPSHKYAKAFSQAKKMNMVNKTRFILDYTVPFIPIKTNTFGYTEIQHIPIGLLQVTSKAFLRGHFDICMSHDQNHIYPCHAGCIINASEGRETDETGDIDVLEMERMWTKALNYGFQNRIIDYSIQ